MSSRVALQLALVALLVCLFVVSGLASGLAAAESTLVVEQHGSGVALEDESMTYLWQYNSYSVTVTFFVPTDGVHTVCLAQDDDDTVDQPLVCQWTAVDAGDPATVTLTLSEWPENISGEETLSLKVYPDRDTTVDPIEKHQQSVHIIEKDGDLAGNGLTNEREIELGTHPALADTDGDGLTDGVEVMLGTDPRDPTTPYRIAVIGIGSLTTGLFGFLLVAGRLMAALRTLGVATSDDSEDATEDTADQPLLDPPVRDEKRVKQLLSTHEGRLKQSQIVEATEWSKSKVSRLLSSMEDDGELTRIRLGRENLVCLRGHEPADISPSWDDKNDSSR